MFGKACFSPANIVGVQSGKVRGSPDIGSISTRHVEWRNSTMPPIPAVVAGRAH